MKDCSESEAQGACRNRRWGVDDPCGGIGSARISPLVSIDKETDHTSMFVVQDGLAAPPNESGRHRRRRRKSPMSILKPLCAAVLGCSALIAGTSATLAQKPFDGVTVNMMTFTGPQIAEPLQRRAPDFEKLTGAKVNVITVPFSDLYQKLLTDWAARHQQLSMPPSSRRNGWSTTSTPGYLEDADRARQGRQGPARRTTSRRSSATSRRQLQRQDLHDPARWRLPDGLLPDRRARGSSACSRPRPGTTISPSPRQPNGKDLNGDGKADYGSCISKKRNAQAYWFITSVAGGFIQSPGHRARAPSSTPRHDSR